MEDGGGGGGGDGWTDVGEVDGRKKCEASVVEGREVVVIEKEGGRKGEEEWKKRRRGCVCVCVWRFGSPG